MESRIYAEDPYRGFLPSTGRLSYYRPPQEKVADGIIVRNDTGVYEGGEISLFYDPMIAKLITHGPDRLSAVDAMSDALDGFRIDGIRHNIDFVGAIMGHQRFRDGNLTTAFIDEEYPEGFDGAPLDDTRQKALAALGYVMMRKRLLRATQTSHVLTSHEYDPASEMMVDIGGAVMRVDEAETGVTLDGQAVALATDWQPGDLFAHAEVDGETICVAVERLAEGYRLTGRGRAAEVKVRSLLAQELMQHVPEVVDDGSDMALICPMPGVVMSVAVAEGDVVKAGQPLAVVEAMKMENILRAEKDVTIAKVLCAEGDKLAVDDIMIEFE
jgi:propionyl-CoA carboxylase alpha chain